VSGEVVLITQQAGQSRAIYVNGKIKTVIPITKRHARGAVIANLRFSGARDVARAILDFLFGCGPAAVHYQKFADDFIAAHGEQEWKIPVEQIRSWMRDRNP
jgi:hypothetical protein